MANHTILLIDYEPRSIERFRDPLIAAGYAVELSTDGISGMEAFQRLNPDMVIVEAMIPKKHGFEVCQELKKTPHGRRTPIIITTGVYKGRKYRTQALHIYGCDEYIEKPIAPAQLLEIVGGFLTPGVSNILMQGMDSSSVSPDSGDRPIASESEDMTAKSGPTVARDDREDEITARLDALLSGTGGASPAFAAAGKSAVATAIDQDPFALMRAELDAELGTNSKPLAFETTPTLEPIVEPLVSDQVEAPSVLESLSTPAPSPAATIPSSTAIQPGQIVDFETKRGRKNKKADRQSTKRSQKLDEMGKVEAAPPHRPAPTPAPAPAPALSPVPVIIEYSEVASPVGTIIAARVNPPAVAPGITLPRGTMVESELEPTAARRGMPVWAWAAVAVVVAVGIYFVFPHGSSKPSGAAAPPAAPPKPVVSAPPVATPPPVAATPAAATPSAETPPATKPSSATPSAATPRAAEPSRSVPESQKPVLVAAKVPAPKKRSDLVSTPSVAPTNHSAPTNSQPVNTEPARTQPAKPEPVATKAPAPPASDTAVGGVETVPNVAMPATPTTIAPGALIPIDLADTMPIAIKHRAPVYSAAAQQLRLSGTVIMNVLVNDRGTVDQVVLVSGVPGADLNDAAMAAAESWTYRAATKNGVPVKVWRSEQVVFKP